MKQLYNQLAIIGFILLLVCYSCKSVYKITEVPADTYVINANDNPTLDAQIRKAEHGNRLTVDIEQTDSLLKLTPHNSNGKPITVRLSAIKDLKIYRNTFDVDVLTVPFKIRPSVRGFPEQLTADFDAALYLGKRRDNYEISNIKARGSSQLQLSGVGFGYGGFIGMGSVAMNPFVTHEAIDYEYSGFVLNGGIAGIFDARRFNVGVALGADYLVDKNRHNWIYQAKPWIGVLFGINLN